MEMRGVNTQMKEKRAMEKESDPKSKQTNWTVELDVRSSTERSKR